MQLGKLAARLAERRLTLDVSEEAEAWLARAGYDPDYGARPLRRVLQHEIEDPLALALLEGRYLEGATVTVDGGRRQDRAALGVLGLAPPRMGAFGPGRSLVQPGHG